MNEALAELPELTADHLRLTLVALAIALGVSLPLGVVLSRSPARRAPVLAVAGVLQTIPSLALLALMVPVLAGLGVFTRRFGVELPVLGFLPAVTALSLYGVLPVLRNTVTGLSEVDAGLIEAGRGLGMTERQLLWRVQLPLAAPVIFAGIRTAAVWVVGTATLATPVGQRCLGDLIFGGLQTRNWSSVVLGCAAAAALALLLDALIGAMERAPGGRRRLWIGGIGALILIALAAWPAFTPPGAAGRSAVVVGAKNFTEQFILARLLRRRLESAGYRVDLREGLGSTIAFDALKGGGVDLYVDYSGTIWSNVMGRKDRADADTVRRAVADFVRSQRGARMLGALGFENAYVIAVRRADARVHGWRTLRDLAAASPRLTMGGDYEFFTRPEWAAVRDAYGLRFRELRRFDPVFLYSAARDGEADAISAFSSDGRIEAYDLVTLDDPQKALPPYDAILLLGPSAAADARLSAALQPLIGGVTIGLMREANRRVDQEHQSPDQAAAWLDARISRSQPDHPEPSR